jgi:hypothetical protein
LRLFDEIEIEIEIRNNNNGTGLQWKIPTAQPVKFEVRVTLLSFYILAFC